MRDTLCKCFPLTSWASSITRSKKRKANDGEALLISVPSGDPSEGEPGASVGASNIKPDSRTLRVQGDAPAVTFIDIMKGEGTVVRHDSSVILKYLGTLLDFTVFAKVLKDKPVRKLYFPCRLCIAHLFCVDEIQDGHEGCCFR